MARADKRKAVPAAGALPAALLVLALALAVSPPPTGAQHIREDVLTSAINPMYKTAVLGGGHTSTVKGDTVFATFLPFRRPPANPLSCRCTDVDPHPTFITRPNYTCWDQYKFGKCGEPFMMETIKEMPEGFCQITCGRCPCCPSLAQAARTANLTEFAWASNRSASWLESLEQPGLLATVLAPTNDAMWQLYNAVGGRDRIERGDPAAIEEMTSILAFHILPAVPIIDATWTTPFFLPGLSIPTLYKGSNLSVAQSLDGYITLRGPQNSAKILMKDIYACAGWLNIIDTVLIPFPTESDGSSTSTSSPEAAASPSPSPSPGPSPSPSPNPSPSTSPSRSFSSPDSDTVVNNGTRRRR